MAKGFLAVATAALALTAAPVQAQHHVTQQPLRTLCMSHAMDYCFNVLKWDVQAPTDPTCDWTVRFCQTRLETTLEFFGPLFGDGSEITNFSAYLPFSEGRQRLIGGLLPRLFEGPRYSLVDISGPFPGSPIAETTDVESAAFFVSVRTPTAGRACSIGLEGPGVDRCAEVEIPEPSTALLLISGLLALGFAQRRRIQADT